MTGEPPAFDGASDTLSITGDSAACGAFCGAATTSGSSGAAANGVMGTFEDAAAVVTGAVVTEAPVCPDASPSGRDGGHGAAADGRTFATACGACVTYTVPQQIRLAAMGDKTEVSFRVNRSFAKSRILVTDETGAVVARFARQHMAPGEMEHIALPRGLLEKAGGDTLTVSCEEVSE